MMYAMGLISFILLTTLVSCSTIKERAKKDREDCVVRLVQADISDEYAHIICKDIYERKK